MNLRTLHLVDFEATDDAQRPEPSPDATTVAEKSYEEGFRDGVARATEGTNQQSQKILAAVSEALQDHALLLAAQRTENINQMLELLEAMLDTIFPPLLARHYGEVIGATTQQILTRYHDDSVTVHANAQQLKGLAAHLPEGIAATPDNTLGPAEVRITAGKQCFQVNTDELMTELRSAVLAPAATNDRMAAHI